MVSNTRAMSPDLLAHADSIAARLIDFGVDVHAPFDKEFVRYLPGSLFSRVTRDRGTVADLAFSALAMQANPGCVFNADFSVYRRLISAAGLELDRRKLVLTTGCPAEFLRFQSVCLDLLLSPHQLELCKFAQDGFVRSMNLFVDMNAAATDLTPFHFSVLSRSYDRLQAHIASGRYAATEDAILSPLQCALGWAEGLRVLASSGDCAVPALQLAVTRQDVDSIRQIFSVDSPMFINVNPRPLERIPRHQAKTNMLEAIICSHCFSAGWQRPCPPQIKRPCCSLPYGKLETESQPRHSSRILLVAALKERRARLVDLALKTLSSKALDELGVLFGKPLDANALATYTALEKAGIPIPAALYPGEKPLLLSFNNLCRVGGFPLTQALFENGMCELNTSFRHITPLARLFIEPLADGLKETAIQWFLEQGANPSFSATGMLPNFLFYLATLYDCPRIYDQNPPIELVPPMGIFRFMNDSIARRLVVETEERRTTSNMVRCVARFCNPMQRDCCRCPCSSGGCLPLHKLRGGLPVREAKYGHLSGWISHRWAGISHTTQAWIRDCCLDERQKRECLRDACRLEVFTRLGMAHACCVFGWAQRDDNPNFPLCQQRDPEMAQEFEDEDVELREQLELILEAHDKTLEMFKGTVDEFWEWWWAILQQLLPEIPPDQRRRRVGDYNLNETYSLRDIVQLPCPTWDYSWPDERDEEEDANAENNVEEGQEKDFVDEIREYFATILSQDSLGTNGTQKAPSVVADVLRGSGGDERGSGDAAAED